VFYSICFLHSSQAQIPTGFDHNTLQAFTHVIPSKGTQTIWKESEWNELKTVRNMTTKDNPGTLPIEICMLPILYL